MLIFPISAPLQQPCFMDKILQQFCQTKMNEVWAHMPFYQPFWGGKGQRPGATTAAGFTAYHLHFRSLRICWELSLLLFDHTSAASTHLSTARAKLNRQPYSCNTSLKAALDFICPFPLMPAHFIPTWSFFAPKWFTLKLKTWGEARTCSTTCLLRPGSLSWQERIR